MNIKDAFYQTVHDSPGGAEALAPRMGMSAAILRNKANPAAPANKPTLEDIDRVMALTSDYRILHALALNHGHVAIEITGAAEASDVSVLDMIAKVWVASGEVGAEVHATLADGIVEPHEVLRVKDAVYRVIQSLNTLVARLDGMAEKS